MDFLFFNAADQPLFSRNDAESASWTVEEMSLYCLFPFDPQREIKHGQRIGFVDETGIFQPFEIRKVRSYEPDHYQEVTAEHICISELTDEHFYGQEMTDMTAQAALSAILAGTLWRVGNVTAVGTSSANIGMGGVWQDVRAIEKNWNVWITPRVTFGPGGITGRYLDIAPAVGVWRGVRLALEKNTDEQGVTWDDSNQVTALYGYGRSVDSESGPLTFADVSWSSTADHPAKPAGQTYIEDPEATALYGRNGRPRFGFYQNGDITDPAILLQKTWESLKAGMRPTVTVDCMVRDLYRLGYADQPIRLHDLAMIDVEPTGEKLQLTIIKLSVDLLDPTATRPTIGDYIPNIIYINRETAERARGGGGGGRGQTNLQKQISEFETEIAANNYQISLRAYQRDLEQLDQVVQESSVTIKAHGVTINSHTTTLNEYGQRIKDAEAEITVNANAITSKVSKGDIASTINQTAQSVLIQASKINLEGYVTVSELNATKADINNLKTGVTVSEYLRANTLSAGSNFYFRGGTVGVVNITVDNKNLDVLVLYT